MKAPAHPPHEITDEEAWLDFRQARSEEAFRLLVTRHVPLVWSVALRTVNGERALAEDVSQTVFADLALLAPRLPARFGVGGWLHRHTFYTASKAVSSEIRRRARERTAATMNPPDLHVNPPEPAISELAPHLDAALAMLSPSDREVIVMRYLQQRSLRDVSCALDVPEDTVRKRLSRALEKLRVILRRRGIAVSGTLLVSSLTAQAAGTSSVGSGLSIAAGAWQIYTGGAGAWAVASTPLMLLTARWGRSAIAAAGGGIAAVLTALVWSGLGRGTENSAPHSHAAAMVAKSPLTTKAQAALSGSVTFDLFYPPAGAASLHLLDFRPGVDDAGLYQELGDPRQSGGISLTVPLSAQGRGSAKSVEAQASSQGGHAASREHDHREVKPQQVDSVVEVTVMAQEDRWLASFVLEHHRSAPLEREWASSSHSAGTPMLPLPQSLPLLFTSSCAAPPGEPVLAASSSLPAANGQAPAAPSIHALLFVTFNPVSPR